MLPHGSVRTWMPAMRRRGAMHCALVGSRSMPLGAMHCFQWQIIEIYFRVGRVVEETLRRAHLFHPGGDGLSHAVLWRGRVVKRRRGRRQACCRTALHTCPFLTGKLPARG